MARLLSEPEEKTAQCGSCKAKIGYMPEEVERHVIRDYSGVGDVHWRVKCPRLGCEGYAYV